MSVINKLTYYCKELELSQQSVQMDQTTLNFDEKSRTPPTRKISIDKHMKPH
jgi:hypothetical protein